MCTNDREFKIEGREDCFARGYERTGFFEVDTGKDAKNWTVQLTDADALKPGVLPMARRSRRVKIIATLGPASAEPEVVEALYRAGADVFRINMSHASHDMMRERVATIRKLEEKVDRPIGILVDLQGPKLRVGLFANGGETLRKGDLFTLDDDPDARRCRAACNCRIPKSSCRCSPATGC